MRDTSIMFTKSFRERDDYATQKAASLVPAADRTTPQKKLAEKHERKQQRGRDWQIENNRLKYAPKAPSIICRVAGCSSDAKARLDGRCYRHWEAMKF